MIKSVAERLVARPISFEKKPKKGILLLPDENAPRWAEVVAVGSDVDDSVMVGDFVLLQSQAGIPIKIGDVEFLSIIQREILAVVATEEET